MTSTAVGESTMRKAFAGQSGQLSETSSKSVEPKRPDGEDQVGGRDDHVDEPGLQVPAREGEQRMDEDGDEEAAEGVADREGDRIVRGAESAEEDRHPDGGHEPPERVVGPAHPRDDAAENE